MHVQDTVLAPRQLVPVAAEQALLPAPRATAPAPASSEAAGKREVAARSSRGESLDALQAFDRRLHAAFGGVTAGLAPSALIGAYLDWATHLLIAPGKQAALAAQALGAIADHSAYAASCITGKAEDPCLCALPHDNRFRSPEWRSFPFNVYAHGFLAMEKWWEAATSSRLDAGQSPNGGAVPHDGR